MTDAGSAVRFAAEGRVEELSATAETLLFERGQAVAPELKVRVAQIIEEVRSEGDTALTRYARLFDGVLLERLEIPIEEARAALELLDPAVRAALELAREAIADFHRAQLPAALEVEPRPGVRLVRRVEPLRRVGVYAPGGRAAYPSSVLMGVVPARVAGVEEIVVCSPPAPEGRPPGAVLAACALAGADRIFALGGAGAVAALAYGTASVPRVEKIVGPGNAYVTEAKRQLNGVVAIDCPAGPSEILIIADDAADAEVTAAELIAQAEHDPGAAAVLVATDRGFLDRVRHSLGILLAVQPRRAIVEEALAARGALLLVDELASAIQFAERYAPEHLLLLTRDPRALVGSVRNAGTVFLGAGSSVAFGDYLTGANHVLPTAGLARAYSGLSTTDFTRFMTVQEVSEDAARVLAGPTATLAEAEGLPGHALAARLRAVAGTTADSATSRGRPHVQSVQNATGKPGPIPRPAYTGIELYDPGRRPCAIDLSDNTNLFGVSPAAAEVLANAQPALVTRYPTVYASALKQALAQRFGVATANVTTGCGSDDVIDSAVRAFCEPGDLVAFPAPTFGVVPLFARMNAARSCAVPLGPGFTLEATPLLDTRAKLIYVCRPNNPTGTLFDRGVLERVVDEATGIVLIDEAYADFAGEDLVDFAVASNRGVVMRTLSKAYGMAGLRIGFAIGPELLIAEIEKSRGPYKIGALAEAAALAALERDGDWVRAGITTVRENRARLAESLIAMGGATMPSSANFLLLMLPAELGSAQSCAAALHAAGVAVRAFPGLPQAGECIRVTVGPWPMMQAFLDRFAALLDQARAAPGDPRL
jgi:histidinol dehydrogenase